jgi:hypothetical protein
MRNFLLAVALFASACAARPDRATIPAETRVAVLTQYLRGASLDALVAQFHLYDRASARAVVHDEMIALTRRYYNDR